VRIPIAQAVDSLNVATAAAIAFYELTAPDRPGR
jgi:tRNA G18 (ribose-2'-O)-methylase SpoU